MLDVKSAVKAAREHAKNLFEEGQLSNLLLEEVEFDDSKQTWLVTLGYDSTSVIKREATQKTYNFLNRVEKEVEQQREYKIFHIKADDGELISMKIRDVE